MMNWDDLKYALAIHRHNGLSGAARKLGVNHATVSRRLAALETELGVRLFDRLPAGLQATSAGLDLVKTAGTMEAETDSLALTIAGMDRALAGPLRISAPQLIIKYVLADFLADFARQHPQIDLSVMATSDAVNLHQREADISIRACNEPEESLWGRKTTSQQRAWYGSKNYLHGIDQETPIQCLHFDWYGTDVLDEIQSIYPKAGVFARFDDMVTVHDAACRGLGVARMPCFIGNSSPELVRVPGIAPEPYLDIWVLTHPDLRYTARISHFMKGITDILDQRKTIFQASDRPLSFFAPGKETTDRQ